MTTGGPQLSDDGRYFYDGQRWQPAPRPGWKPYDRGNVLGGLLLSLLIAPAGTVFGIVLLTRRQPEGWVVVAISLAVWLAVWLLLSAL